MILIGGGTRSQAPQDLINAGSSETDVICLFGTSLVAGEGSSGDAATGPREAFFQALRRYRSKFTLVGPHGEGALNGTGTTWGRFHPVDDFHAPDSPPPLGQWNHHGESGRKMSASFTVSAVNDMTNVITAPGHDLGNGSLFVISSTGSVPGGLSASMWNFASGVSGNNLQAASLEGGTAIDLTSQGSGTITIGTGLSQLAAVTLPILQPKTIIVSAGTNDAFERVAAADPDALGTLQARAILMLDAIEAGAPNADRYMISSIPSVYSPATNFAAVAALIASFNAWLQTYVKTRGPKWAFTDGAKNLTAAHANPDGTHLLRSGNTIMAENWARDYYRATQGAAPGKPVPRPFKMRRSHPVLNMTATTHKVSIPDQESIRVGSDNALWAVWYRPSSLPDGTNVVMQQNVTYTDGFMVAQTGSDCILYFRAGAPVIPASSYTDVFKIGEWTRIVVIVDHAADKAALYANGSHVQTVNITDATISVQQAFSLGTAGGLNAAIGQYQELLIAHGPDITIANAIEIVEADYWDGDGPPNVSARYPLDEGTGTSVAGTVPGSTAGTITGATWIAAGVVPRYGIDDGAVEIESVYGGQFAVTDIKSANYTASWGQWVRVDASITVNAPTAIGSVNRSFVVKNVTDSVLTITIDGFGSELVDGQLTYPLIGARAVATFTSDGSGIMVK